MLGGLSSQTKSVGTKAEKTSMTAKKAEPKDRIGRTEGRKMVIACIRRVLALFH